MCENISFWTMLQMIDRNKSKGTCIYNMFNRIYMIYKYFTNRQVLNVSQNESKILIQNQ